SQGYWASFISCTRQSFMRQTASVSRRNWSWRLNIVGLAFAAAMGYSDRADRPFAEALSMPATALPVLRVKAREERRVKGGHPWVYSNEIELDAQAKALPPGGLVRLVDNHGGGIGIASFNPHSL